MKKQEPRWYILWFITAGMWFITFCGNFYHNTMLDWVIAMQFLNIFLSLVAGFVNANRYKKRNFDDKEQ